MLVTVRDVETGDPVEGAMVSVDGASTAAATDAYGGLTCSDSTQVQVFTDSMSWSVRSPAAKLAFSDPAGDREVWIESGGGMPGGG